MAPLLLIGAALGGAAMYYLDPDRGRRRRALVRDKAVKAHHDAHELWEQGTRDLANRANVLKGRAQSMLTRRKATDEVLAERVRSRMGRFVGHPGAIEVNAAGGVVTLGGSILAHEHDELIEGISKVRGVRDIVDQLKVYERADGISELQGAPRGRRGDADLVQDNWAPGTRLVAGAGATALTLYSLMRSNRLTGFITFATGAALLARTVTNKPLGRALGLAGPDAVHVQKTININTPVEAVFEYLANYDNFPQFMRNVLSVDMMADGRSHWKVMGPAGVPVEWDAVTTTALELNERIEWSTVEGSLVEHVGGIKLEPEAGGTRVHIQMTYTPPAGVLGHAVAKLTGADPKTQLDEDMMRLKSALETGRAPRDAAAQRHEEPTQV